MANGATRRSGAGYGLLVQAGRWTVCGGIQGLRIGHTLLYSGANIARVPLGMVHGACSAWERASKRSPSAHGILGPPLRLSQQAFTLLDQHIDSQIRVYAPILQQIECPCESPVERAAVQYTHACNETIVSSSKEVYNRMSVLIRPTQRLAEAVVHIIANAVSASVYSVYRFVHDVYYRIPDNTSDFITKANKAGITEAEAGYLLHCYPQLELDVHSPRLAAVFDAFIATKGAKLEPIIISDDDWQYDFTNIDYEVERKERFEYSSLPETKIRNEKEEFFLDTCEMTPQEVLGLFLENPQLEKKQVAKDLRPIVSFLLTSGVATTEEIRDNPRILMYSLKSRILPRYFATRGNLTIEDIIEGTDASFCENMGISARLLKYYRSRVSALMGKSHSWEYSVDPFCPDLHQGAAS